MKQHILTVAAAALLSIPTFSIAEDKPAGDKPAGDKPAGERRGPGGGRQWGAEERLKMMTERLGLTEDQQAKIKEIYAKNEEAFKAAREKGRENLTDEDRKKLGEAMRAQAEEVNAVLTPEQKEKMKEMGQRRRGEGRPGGPGAPGGEKKEGQ
jgi:periplasmic protein CpxP/Spy